MIDYIILIGIIIIIILVIITLIKNVNESNITERLGKLETTTIKEISSFKIDMMKNLTQDFDKMNEMLEYRLTMMNEKVNERLDENFTKTNRAFTNIVERLSKIDEAQKKNRQLINRYCLPPKHFNRQKKSWYLWGNKLKSHLNKYLW